MDLSRGVLMFIPVVHEMRSRSVPDGFLYLTSILGRAFSSQEVAGFLLEMGGVSEVSTVEDRTYYVFKRRGIDVDVENGRVAALFLFSEGLAGHSAFFKGLPEGLSFSSDREAVRRAMGKPDSAREGEEIPFYGFSLPSDKYVYGDCAIVVEYAADLLSVSMVTLQVLTQFPGAGP
ncbi:hypothetical protein [Hyalangium gracile]|uniref:hypothetical protein n=1 Tax=Hyalangium gracile TaxID=394092 RepID=UPI001CCEA161|nr:hypothetical protein [Hyalangium gracile]